MINCPKCTEVFESDAAFKQHAITIHHAPADVINGTSQKAIINLPPGAKQIEPIDPKVIEAAEEAAAAQTYIPQGDVKSRPRTAEAPKVIAAVKPPDIQPIKLIYKYEGTCPKCGTIVATSLVKVKTVTLCLAYCAHCNEVVEQKEVKPL